jgi:hypothetical protein
MAPPCDRRSLGLRVLSAQSRLVVAVLCTIWCCDVRAINTRAAAAPSNVILKSFTAMATSGMTTSISTTTASTSTSTITANSASCGSVLRCLGHLQCALCLDAINSTTGFPHSIAQFNSMGAAATRAYVHLIPPSLVCLFVCCKQRRDVVANGGVRSCLESTLQMSHPCVNIDETWLRTEVSDHALNRHCRCHTRV